MYIASSAIRRLPYLLLFGRSRRQSRSRNRSGLRTPPHLEQAIAISVAPSEITTISNSRYGCASSLGACVTSHRWLSPHLPSTYCLHMATAALHVCRNTETHAQERRLRPAMKVLRDPLQSCSNHKSQHVNMPHNRALRKMP